MFTFHGRTMLLGNMFTQDEATLLGSAWLALVRRAVSPADTGETIDELDEPSYTRVGYGLTSGFWTPTAYGELVNSQQVYWPAATTPWGLVSGWALCTAPIGGLCIAGGVFVVPSFVDVQGMVAVAPGMLALEMG